MKDIYRKNLFALFTLFFVITTPFLVILSLGFYPDLVDKELANTLSTTIETFPGGSTVSVGGDVVLTQNGEIKTGDGKFLSVSIEKQDYLDEKFSIWSKKETNSLAKITPLYLLPKQGTSIYNFSSHVAQSTQDLASVNLSNQPNQSNQLISEILDEDAFLSGFQGSYFIYRFDTNGVQNKVLPVLNKFNINLVGDKWTPLHENIFWSSQNQSILIFNNNQWQLQTFNNLPFSVANLAQIDLNNILIQSDDQNLWLYNISENSFQFLDSKISGLSFTQTPDVIWIWKGDSVYRFNRNLEAFQFFNPALATVYTQPELLKINQSDFKYGQNDSDHFLVKNAFQGMVFFFDGEIYYIPDYNQSSWTLLASSVSQFTIDGSTLFWQDKQDNLFAYNIPDQFTAFLGNIKVDGLEKEKSMFYYDTWKRLFLYSKNQVVSVWFNKDLKVDSPSAAVIQYYPQIWLDQQKCYPKIIERIQFCVQNTNIKMYKNQYITSIF